MNKIERLPNGNVMVDGAEFAKEPEKHLDHAQTRYDLAAQIQAEHEGNTDKITTKELGILILEGLGAAAIAYAMIWLLSLALAPAGAL